MEERLWMDIYIQCEDMHSEGMKAAQEKCEENS